MGSFRQSVNLGDDISLESRIVDQDEGHFSADIRPMKDENHLEVNLPEGLSLPGRGQRKQETCGQFRSAYATDEMDLRIKRYNCHSITCPICFRQWALQQAERSAGYLWAFAEQYHRKLYHWTLSPSKDLIDSLGTPVDVFKTLDKLLKKTIDKFVGWNDSVVSVVIHPARKHCPNCSATSETESFCIPCGTPYSWYWSPHLHVITDFHYEFSDVEAFVGYEKEKQFIFKCLGLISTKEDLAKVISYELGHSLQYKEKRVQSIRYFGFSAKTHFRSDVSKQTEIETEEKTDESGIVRVLKFYKLQNQMCDEAEPGRLVITKDRGMLPFLKENGDRVPLTRTTFHYKLEALGQILNGKWVRFTLPKDNKPIKDTRKVWDTIGWEKRYLGGKNDITKSSI